MSTPFNLKVRFRVKNQLLKNNAIDVLKYLEVNHARNILKGHEIDYTRALVKGEEGCSFDIQLNFI